MGTDSALVGFFDADWAGERDARKMKTGYCSAMNFSPIMRRIKRQNVVALHLLKQNMWRCQLQPKTFFVYAASAAKFTLEKLLIVRNNYLRQ